MRFQFREEHTRVRRIITVLAVAMGVSGSCLVASACGASDAILADTNSCNTKFGGTASRIFPENSDLTCKEIRTVLILLPDEVGVWPIYGDSDKVMKCRVFPPRKLPLITRCVSDGKSFTVKAR